MQFISSDTNIWIDFKIINEMALPFILPYKYVMYYEAINKELIYPEGLSDELIKYGLESVDIALEEFFAAEEFGEKYPKLSVYDRIALAIAKERNIVLLTGDKALRLAVQTENVKFIGTIAIVDELYNKNLIDKSKYKQVLQKLLQNNGTKIRLPEKELKNRLKNL